MKSIGTSHHYACFQCRKSFKRPKFTPSSNRFMTADQVAGQSKELAEFESNREYRCPDCGNYCSYMGLDFKLPKQSDTRAWQAAETFIRSGKTFTRGTPRDS